MSGLVLDDVWVPDVAEYYAVNITGLRLVSPEKRKVKKILNEWKKLDKKNYKVFSVILCMDHLRYLILYNHQNAALTKIQNFLNSLKE